MIKNKLLLLTAGLAFHSALAQHADPKLSLEWSGNLKHAELKITNEGEHVFPRSGWKIYFNRQNFTVIDSTRLRIIPVNGDLFALVPQPNLTDIAPSQSSVLKVDGGNIRNITDFPEGFYLVWDDEPSKGYDIKKFHVVAPPNAYDNDLRYAAENYKHNNILSSIPVNDLPLVFPSPLQYKRNTGKLRLIGNVTVSSPAIFAREASLLADVLSGWTGHKAIVNTGGKASNVTIKQSRTINSPEAYRLSVTQKGIEIEAPAAAGVFYAIRSLQSAMSPNERMLRIQAADIPCMEIYDTPRFAERVMMLDVARNFRSKEQVMRIIDLLSMYKINTLHFHFIDDEGWRIAIPGLPELTTVGAKRGHTITGQDMLPPSYGTGAGSDNANGTGYYTREDYIEILKYARDRHMLVVPEIESPGHAHAAIKAMEARYYTLRAQGKIKEAEEYLLSDLNDKSEYKSVQGWNDNVINVAKPSVYHFMQKVTDELIRMHKEAGLPITKLHFGGDEVPAGVWEKSPEVLALMKANPQLRNTGDLWHYYFSKIDAMLKTRGITLSGWEEIGLTKVKQGNDMKYVPEPRFKNNNFQTEVWNNVPGAEGLPYELANAGYNVLLTCVTNFYFDLAADRSFYEPGQYWGGYIDLNKPFNFIPYDYYKNHDTDHNGEPVDPKIYADKERLTAFGKTKIKGLQAALWAEVIKSDSLMEYILFPKLLGLSERSWAPAPAWAEASNSALLKSGQDKAWNEFVNRVAARELPRLDQYGRHGVHYRIPAPGMKIENGQVFLNSPYPGMQIRYTNDGNEPTINSELVSGPLKAEGNLKFRLFNGSGRSSRTLSYRSDIK